MMYTYNSEGCKKNKGMLKVNNNKYNELKEKVDLARRHNFENLQLHDLEDIKLHNQSPSVDDILDIMREENFVPNYKFINYLEQDKND